MNRYHIGPRTLKTALAVALALLFANLRGSPAPIFAGIGAIVAMSRTIQDAVKVCLTQLAGVTCGVILGGLYLLLLPGYHVITVGIGIVLVITCCNVLRVEYAVPLSCIVFVSMCLTPAGSDFVLYGVNRFLDTALGLVTALAVNVVVRPYRNRMKILNMLHHIRRLFPDYLRERVLLGHYPALSTLRLKLQVLHDELAIFKTQPVTCLTERAAQRKAHAAPRKAHAQEAAYLQGCEQLLVKMSEELTSLCAMDVCPAPDPALAERLAALGLMLPENLDERSRGASAEDIAVQNFHLRNLLDANDFLGDLLSLSHN